MVLKITNFSKGLYIYGPDGMSFGVEFDDGTRS